MPATLALTLGAPATFGAFTPGVAREYTASTTATVISTAGDATLSVADTARTRATWSTARSRCRAAAGPGVAKTWTGPTQQYVGVTFKQLIKATDALRTGAYSKTLTFTLSTTTP